MMKVKRTIDEIIDLEEDKTFKDKVFIETKNFKENEDISSKEEGENEQFVQIETILASIIEEDIETSLELEDLEEGLYEMVKDWD